MFFDFKSRWAMGGLPKQKQNLHLQKLSERIQRCINNWAENSKQEFKIGKMQEMHFDHLVL